MITNAMWFKNDDEESSDQSGFSVGPIDFTVKELYASIVTSLIIIPPMLIIAHLFAKSDPSRNQKGSKYKISNDGATLGNRLTQTFESLPYWCIYVGFAIIILAVTASAFFTILYAFEWGKKKSEKWLVTFFLTFVESVVFVQPLKVVYHFVNCICTWKTTII